MRKKLTAVALAGTMGLIGVGAAALPALAAATPKSSTEAPETPTPPQTPQPPKDRAEVVKQALKGLVENGTITQEQANEVAETLAKPGALPGGRHGRPGPGLLHGGGLLGVEGPKADEAAAEVLGISVAELRTEVGKGTTLAELAKQHGKDVDTLVAALVDVAQERLAAQVKAGRLTQETADRIEKTLPQRVRTVVQNGRPEFGRSWRLQNGERAFGGGAQRGSGGEGKRGGPDRSGLPEPPPANSGDAVPFPAPEDAAPSLFRS